MDTTTLEYLTQEQRTDSMPEPMCALCGNRPVIATCHVCRRALCMGHVANLDLHLIGNWASCAQHRRQVDVLNTQRWEKQWEQFEGE